MFRMTDSFRAGWAGIIALGEHAEAERAKANRKRDTAEEIMRQATINVVASRITDRWRAAGFTSAKLVDGLPRPERPHVAGWRTEGRSHFCSVCGRPGLRSPLPATCDGQGGFDLVRRAVAAGVPFGLQNGLPTAGVPLEPGNIVEKLERATCQPQVRREERSAT